MPYSMGVSQIRGTFSGGLYNEDHTIMGVYIRVLLGNYRILLVSNLGLFLILSQTQRHILTLNPEPPPGAAYLKKQLHRYHSLNPFKGVIQGII